MTGPWLAEQTPEVALFHLVHSHLDRVVVDPRRALHMSVAIAGAVVAGGWFPRPPGVDVAGCACHCHRGEHRR